MLLIDVNDALEKARESFRQQRLNLGLTQAGLAKRSGVKLPTLRKFEQTGKISFESLCKLALPLDLLPQLFQALTLQEQEFRSMAEVLKPEKPKRQRGWQE